MREECQNACTRAAIALKGTSLLETVEDFVRNIDSIRNCPAILARFYEYMQAKYRIPCEAGMLFVEKLVMHDFFERYRRADDPQNALANEKMQLYQWICPRHLDAVGEPTDEDIVRFRRLAHTSLPSAKMHRFMQAVKSLSRSIGASCGSDAFFPSLVYCLIKAQIPDLYLHVRFMQAYRRPFYRACAPGCTHGFSQSVRCDCLQRTDWRDEEEYYLVAALAALEFIQQIEYYSLRVSLTEFNYEISNKIRKMKLTEKRSFESK